MLVTPLLVTVDPGLRACGVAVFRDGVLTSAFAVRGPADVRGPRLWRSLGGDVCHRLSKVALFAQQGHLLVETMQVHTTATSKGDPDDLLELQGVASAVVSKVPNWWSVEGVLTRDWNGQVPSAVRRERTQKWVTDNGWTDRVDLNTTARFQQDIWSAIGIGRWKIQGHK